MAPAGLAAPLAGARHAIFAGLILAALSVPGVLVPGVSTELRGQEILVRERRDLAAVSLDQAWERLPRSLERGFADRLGLRTSLLGLAGALRWRGLGEAPGQEVVRGAGGWLFLDNGQHLDHWRGATAISDEDLAAWVAMFATRAREAEALGAEYRVALLPAKATLYPHLAPDRYARIGPSRRDRVAAALESAGLKVFDPVPALESARADDDPSRGDFLYHRYGPHWSGRGERVAAEALARELGLALRPLDWERRPGEREQEDNWGRRIYVEQLTPEMPEEWWPTPDLDPGEPLPGGPMNSRRFEGAPGGAALVLHHDSFGRGVRELLGRDHSLVALWSSHFDQGRTAEARPQFVVDWYVEWRVAGDPRRVYVDGPAAREALWARGEQLWWSLRTGGQGTARVLGQRETPVSVDEPLTITSDGSPAFLILDGLPDLGVDHLLGVDLEAPGEGFVEVAALGGGGGPRRRDTQRVPVVAGRSRVLLPIRSMLHPRGPLVVLLDAGEGVWALHGAQLRKAPGLAGPLLDP